LSPRSGADAAAVARLAALWTREPRQALFELAAAAQSRGSTPRAACGSMRTASSAMSKDASSKPAPLPEPVVSSCGRLSASTWSGSAGSPYTARNYRTAFEDFYRWLASSGLWSAGIDALGPGVRDFVIEAQRRYGRRTLHNHVSGLRSFCKFWMRKAA